MKKWIIRIVVGLFAVVVIVLATVFITDAVDKAVIAKYVKNENLETLRNDWRGVPVDEKGRFVNHEHPFIPKTIDLFKWQLGAKPFKQEKADDAERLKVLDPTEFFDSEKDGILWLGHAAVYIRLNGKTMLTDPVFGEPSFINKYVDVPNQIEQIKKLDYVLLSHDHRDHCDEPTLRAIAKKFPNAKFLAGLGMEDILNEWKTETNTVETAGWFQEYKTDDRVKIAYVPVRHWCRRGLFDFNQRLWGGFVISGAGKKIYFGGDSGYGAHYRETAETFGAIDYFIIGIGAYEPRWFMEANHNNPADAFQGFLDIKAKTLVPMHYGTFDLSDEPPNQPLKLLKQEAEKAGAGDKVRPITIGESVVF